MVELAVTLRSIAKARAVLQIENLALRHQLSVLRRTAPKRSQLNTTDRLLWIGISRLCADWRSWLIIVQPETVIGWHRKLFRAFWTWKIRPGQGWSPRSPECQRRNKATAFSPVLTTAPGCRHECWLILYC